jgi:hypothetical protein
MIGPRRTALAAAMHLVLAPIVRAAEVAEAADRSGDYRGKVYFAATLVFAAIVGYLTLTHRRGRRHSEDLDRIERRLSDLESRGRGGA